MNGHILVAAKLSEAEARASVPIEASCLDSGLGVIARYAGFLVEWSRQPHRSPLPNPTLQIKTRPPITRPALVNAYRELAKGTGYRTIIRRDRDELWDVMMLTMDSLELLLVEAGVPADRAKAFWEKHEYSKCHFVALLWPSGNARARSDASFISDRG